MENRDKRVEELKKHNKQYEAEITLLKSIKRNHKKDGSDFSVMGKNFSIEEPYTLKVVTPDYTIKSLGKAIEVYGRVDDIFVDASIDITPTIDTTKTTIAEDRIIKESYIKPYFIMNPDEVETAIKDQIEAREHWIEVNNDSINKLSTDVYDSFREEIKDIVRRINEYAGDNVGVKYDILRILKEELY